MDMAAKRRIEKTQTDRQTEMDRLTEIKYLVNKMEKEDGRNGPILINGTKYELPTFYVKYARNFPTFL